MADVLVITLGFTLGLFSTLHCLGMCGAIVSALACAAPGSVVASPLRRNGYIFLYNLGRIATYALLGMVAGAGGGLLIGIADPAAAQRFAGVVAGSSLALAGLYLGGWVPAVRRVDLAGQWLWRGIQPIGRRLLPIRSPLGALAAGLAWGWLPCGLVYYALLTAAPLANPWTAAMFMVAFGLGTVPGMQATGAFGGLLVRATRHARVRAAAATTIVLLGLVAVLVALSGSAHRFMPFDGSTTGLHHGHNHAEWR